MSVRDCANDFHQVSHAKGSPPMCYFMRICALPNAQIIFHMYHMRNIHLQVFFRAALAVPIVRIIFDMCQLRKVYTQVGVISCSLRWLDWMNTFTRVACRAYQCGFSCTFRTLPRPLNCVDDTLHLEKCAVYVQHSTSIS